MIVYLVRHGEAGDNIPDSERELTDRGIAQISSVAKKLKEKKVDVSLIQHSTYLRAKQSAELISQIVLGENQEKEVQNLTPEDDPAQWVVELEQGTEDRVLVGHNPFMSKLSYILGGPQGFVQFQTATIAAFENNNGAWKLLWTLRP